MAYRRIVALTTIVVMASGCAVVNPSQPGPQTPTTTPSLSPAPPTTTPTIPSTVQPASPTVSVAPTPDASSPTSATPTPTKTPTATGVRASGKLTLYGQNLVSDTLRGTCTKTGGKPTLRVGEKPSEFFDSVDVRVTLSSSRTVETMDIDLGEDSESISHTLRAGPKVSGTKASARQSGRTFQISGSATMTDDGHISARGVPFTLTITCASDNW